MNYYAGTTYNEGHRTCMGPLALEGFPTVWVGKGPKVLMGTRGESEALKEVMCVIAVLPSKITRGELGVHISPTHSHRVLNEFTLGRQR